LRRPEGKPDVSNVAQIDLERLAHEFRKRQSLKPREMYKEALLPSIALSSVHSLGQNYHHSKSDFRTPEAMKKPSCPIPVAITYTRSLLRALLRPFLGIFSSSAAEGEVHCPVPPHNAMHSMVLIVKT
jgi:hypothetical protein